MRDDGLAAAFDIIPGPVQQPARVLIVDDSKRLHPRLHRAKGSPGFFFEETEDAAQAVALVRQGGVDAILLNLDIHDAAGLAVLRQLKRDPLLEGVPVIVVSTWQEDPSRLLQVMDLGPDGILPCSFDLPMLQERLKGPFNSKRLREREGERAGVVKRLIEAAEGIEERDFHPKTLAFDGITPRNDELGRLARVFRGMALALYEREALRRKRIRALKGTLLVIIIGLALGGMMPLARIAAQHDVTPLALSVWNNGIAAALLLSIAAATGRLRRPNGPEMLFLLGWVVINIIGLRLTQFWVAGHVPAAALSLIMTFRGFITLFASTALGLERLILRRGLGLGIGLIAAGMLILSRDVVMANVGFGWLAAAAAIPAILASQTLYLATRLPRSFDAITAMGLAHLIGLAVTLPAALIAGDALMPNPELGLREVAVIGIGVGGALSAWLAIPLVRIAGPVFASQTAYTAALAGIVLSILLLGETLPPIAWATLLLMFVGLYFVNPRESGEDSTFRLPILPCVNRSQS